MCQATPFGRVPGKSIPQQAVWMAGYLAERACAVVAAWDGASLVARRARETDLPGMLVAAAGLADDGQEILRAAPVGVSIIVRGGTLHLEPWPAPEPFPAQPPAM